MSSASSQELDNVADAPPSNKKAPKKLLKVQASEESVESGEEDSDSDPTTVTTLSKPKQASPNPTRIGSTKSITKKSP